MISNESVSQHPETKYDYIVVGAGFAGSTIAHELAKRGSKKILLLEKREHIGGNAYDSPDRNGLIIHKYGPHIFHTNSRRVYNFISRFTEWYGYQHRALANVRGKLIPVPFNLNSLDTVFTKNKAEKIRKKLIDAYGIEKKVSILELKENSDADLRKLAEYIYLNIYLYYTEKQWGARPETVDPAVTARVPVFISRDNRYFQDKYQGVPLKGYHTLFKNILKHPNIDIKLNTSAKDMLKFSDKKILYQDKLFDGALIYTGAIDELFACCFGRLPYRTLKFQLFTFNKEWKQPCGIINYTVDKAYTRITEFKHLTGQEYKNRTTIMKEYSHEYHGLENEIPYYPISNANSNKLYKKYFDLARTFPRFFLLGRLAEYKYYNMDTIVEESLELADQLLAMP